MSSFVKKYWHIICLGALLNLGAMLIFSKGQASTLQIATPTFCAAASLTLGILKIFEKKGPKNPGKSSKIPHPNHPEPHGPDTIDADYR
jgi:hypothetical protein